MRENRVEPTSESSGRFCLKEEDNNVLCVLDPGPVPRLELGLAVGGKE